MLGHKTYYITKDKKSIDLIDTILKPESSLNYYEDNRMQDFSNLKNYIMEKHCGLNRVKTLLSQIPKV